jgi:signal transduction histidine kinase
MSAEPVVTGRFRLLWCAFVLTWLGVAGLVFASVLIMSVTLILLGGAGMPLTLGALPWLRGFADWHRGAFGRLTGRGIDRPYLPEPAGRWSVRLSAAARDPASWRDGAWLLVNGTAGVAGCLAVVILFAGGVFYLVQPAIWPMAPRVVNARYGLFTVHDVASAFLIVPIGAAGLLLWWWLTPGLLRADARLGRWLLSPSERSRLAGRVRELAQSRAETVDAQAAELRRVERDLHDGAQARLVGLGMSLGMADELMDTDPEQARELLREARSLTGAALSDLRDLVRGIHPPVLAERGLDGAIRALALAVPVRVDVDVDLGDGRLPQPLEAAAYFAVAEALTNVVKHSEASAALVLVRRAGGRLTIEVGDDGRGGAGTSSSGTGLAGIRRRLAAFDGTLRVSSPSGGPTLVTMEVPCEPS